MSDEERETRPVSVVREFARQQHDQGRFLRRKKAGRRSATSRRRILRHRATRRWFLGAKNGSGRRCETHSRRARLTR